MDKEFDCLKFKLIQGNIGEYIDLLKELDAKMETFQ